MHPISRSADDLMAVAREQTGIDLFDYAIVEALTVLVASLNSEANLSEAGAAAMSDRLLRVLRNRLRVQRDLTNHPEILDEQIVSPVILTGAGRTGSTKLHKMLAASGDFQWLPFWQGHNPGLITGVRSEPVEPRVREAEQDIAWFNAAAPSAKAIHAFIAEEPEEEIQLMEMNLFGPYVFAFVNVPSFAGWYSQQPLVPQYKALRAHLQYLQWQTEPGSARPWLLKSPAHFGVEEELLQVFPDARLIATHRDPRPTITSGASLIQTYHAAYARTAEPGVGAISMTTFQIMSDRHLAARSRPSFSILDVAYARVVSDAAGVTEEIYRYLAMPLSQAAGAAMQDWEARNAQHRHGAHKYDISEMGLTEEMIALASANYRVSLNAYL